MGICRLAFATVGLLLSCSPAPPPSPPPVLPPAAPTALELDEILPFSARAILDLIDSSTQNYSITINPRLKPYDLKAGTGEHLAPSPFWYVVRTPGGIKLRTHREPPCALELDNQALTAFALHDYASAVSFYQESLRCAPDHLKTLTWIGNVYYAEGELDSARFYLEQAVSANPLDYQAHYFLAETYMRSGMQALARASILQALMLSSHNLNVMEAADRILRAGGEEIDYGRLRFGFSLLYNPQGVSMEFADSGASSLVLASCLAAWEREGSLQAYRQRDSAQVCLRHCLLNQALAAQALNEQGLPLDRGSLDLVKALENGTMGPLLLWEVLAAPYPQVMYLVSDQDRAEVLRYLDLSVVRRKRL